MRSRPGRAAALAAIAVACASAAADPWRVERDRAEAIAAKIELEWPLVGSSDAAPSLIRQIGDRLADAVHQAPYPWIFTVVRDRSANAFAIGGGHIYVTEGTVTACRDESELAAVLAHEMAHELAGHLRSFGDATNRRSEDAGVPMGPVVQSIDPEKELLADRLSLEILRGAGYDPLAALTIATRLAGSHERGSRHFGDERRIAALKTLLRDERPRQREDSDAFRRVREDLLDRESRRR